MQKRQTWNKVASPEGVNHKVPKACTNQLYGTLQNLFNLFLERL